MIAFIETRRAAVPVSARTRASSRTDEESSATVNVKALM